MILYTSDIHFGHGHVIKFDNRPFNDPDEMDHVMIELWNGRVQPEDTVYIVGDLCYRSKHLAEWYLRQLKGHKYLILGNHDQPIVNDPAALQYLEGVDKMMEIKDGDRRICLCYYPIIEWNAYYHGIWHVYGHIHNRKNEAYEIMKNKDHLLHYKEYGVEDAPSLSTLFNDGRYENQDRIIDYLKKGRVTVVATQYDKDVFSGETIHPLQTKCNLTDGEYSWSSDLAYYVEKYNVRLPKEVENRMLAKGIESN